MPTSHDISRSRATSATISDVAEGSHSYYTPPTSLFHIVDKLHATLAHDLREFSLGTVGAMDFFDFIGTEDGPSDVDMAMPSTSPPPSTSQETARPKESPLHLPAIAQTQPQLYPHRNPQTNRDYYSREAVSPVPPESAHIPSHNQYFHTTLQQEPSNLLSEPRRSTIAITHTGSGGLSGNNVGTGAHGFGSSSVFPPGFQNGWGSGFGHSPIILDSSWTSFVEQLGFCQG